MDLSHIRGAVFDKDGTLFDFRATWEPWAAGFLVRLFDGDAVRAGQVGAALGYDLDAQRFASDCVFIAGTPDDMVDALAPHLPHLSKTALLDRINGEAQAAPQAAVPELDATLLHLAGAGLRLGVATNDAEAPARAHLASAGVEDRFDAIYGYDSGHGAKPAPGALLAFCAATGLAPQSCLMVGDSLHDLHAGRAAGMVCVAVLSGIATRQTLEPSADVVLSDIRQLPTWLGLL